jgi:hypothetical protein
MTEKHTPTLPAEINAWATKDGHWQFDAPTLFPAGVEAKYVLKSTHEAELSRLRNSHTALVAALTKLVCANPSPVARDYAQARELLAALSAEGEKDAPKDERHLTLDEQATFSQALRDSGSVRQTIPVAPKDDGWIEWKGGECPVPGAVNYRLRDGTEWEDVRGSSLIWDHSEDGRDLTDIVAYRRAR